MYLHIDDPKSSEYSVLDVLTGCRIPGVQAANDKTGEMTLFLRNSEGDLIEDGRGNVAEFKFKGKIKLIHN